jgi:mannose-6-phosphate isomerase-like protein (cupin superfamily)
MKGLTKQTKAGARAKSGRAAAKAFNVSHPTRGAFKADGLRAFFEYRDLGIAKASRGKILAHVIRARAGKGAKPDRHYHRLDFQMVYVLKGWVEFEYEGVGRVRLRKGSCVYQPPGIHHVELRHSRDLEMIEITSPARFATRRA